jgi:bifunctional non-homologous end joining protein LigD
LPIAGFALDGEKWDGLYVGRQTGKELIYAVKVDHGFDKTSAAELRRRLMPLIRKTQPCAKRIAIEAFGLSRRCWPRSNTARNLPEEKARHPFFNGLREDR